MTYLTAYHDKRVGKVMVWEKSESGQRVRTLFDPIYYFYARKENGKFLTITDEHVEKIQVDNHAEFDTTLADYQLRRIPVFESDFTPTERVLFDHYSLKPIPVLDVGFLDIETDYQPNLGFSSPENPYAPINAITILLKDVYHTIAIPPQSWGDQKLPGHLKHVILVKTEKELLELMLDIISKTDVISGWNSEFFDLPYIGGRVELVLGEHALARLAFEGGPTPRWTEKERYKGATKKEKILDLQTRIHLDYLKLFQKFDLTKRQSYSLNNVSFEELGEKKVEYDGSLHELYNNDFVKFIEYNIHDVTLLKRLDAKRKYIELANQMVHEGSVLFPSVFGSVNLIDSAIINYSHNVLNRIVIDKEVRPENDPVEGAIVLTPNPGFYKWVGMVDIGSLYPNTMRSLNLSPEKIIGQLLGLEADWRKFYEAIQNPDDIEKQTPEVEFRIDNTPESLFIPIGEFVKICKENKYAVSGYGTVLDQSNGVGLIPSILGYWFNGRKELQKKKKIHGKNADELVLLGSNEFNKNSTRVSIFDKKKNEMISYYLNNEQYSSYIKEKDQEEYADMLQGVKKVLLNSLYGAALSPYMRFGDIRLGASTTFSGRQITSNMANIASMCLNPDHPKIKKEIIIQEKKKRNGTVERHINNEYKFDIGNNAGPIYIDTDSCFFTMRNLVSDYDSAIALADEVAEIINNEFPSFMMTAFNCQPGHENLIKANREIVCRSGILQAKKKYMMMIIDKEGKRIEPGSDDELKTMGSDIRVSSTPYRIKVLLKEVVMMILNEVPQKEINKVIIDFRNSLSEDNEDSINPLELATVNSVNKLDEAFLLWDRFERQGLGKAKLHVNVRSAINYNWMLKKFKVQNEAEIKSGDKVKILWLEKNEYGYTSMAFPSEMSKLPDWFLNAFSIDKKAMEQKLVDGKLELIFEPLGWEVPTYQSELIGSLLEF